MPDIFDMFNLTRYGNSEVITPQNIVSDMVDLLPQEVFNPDTTFLDPAVKSGRFLKEIYTRLFKSDSLITAFPDENERREHILHNQLFGIALSATAATLSRFVLYKVADIRGNIIYDDNYIARLSKRDETGIRTIIKGAFDIMQFDIVIGNPPYNNDLYLDFVSMGHRLSKQYTCMITPAKWQAKGGKKNEDFRQNIVPYMSKIVYYPDCTDIFAIEDPGGISYYIINKKYTYENKYIKNIAIKQTLYNDEETRKFDTFSLYNKGTHIAQKVMKNERSLNVESLNKSAKYQVWSANKVSLVSNIPKTCLWSTDGMFNCLGLQQIAEKGTKKVVYETNGLHKSTGVPTDSKLIFSSDSIDVCKSFISYCYTRTVRYLLSLSLCGLTGIATGNEWWRFVPDPGSFDHIFTDQELYQKYNLTPEEITIIESVIKERN